MSEAAATVSRFDSHDEGLHERVVAAPGIVLCTDFDGTLAPIESDPDAPEITPENRRVLETLRDHDRARVAVVSGRALEDVRERVGIEGIVYAGNHGLELDRNGETTVHPVAAKRRRRIEWICEYLAEALAPIEGAVVENKAITATVHFRNAPDERVPEVREAVSDALDRFGDGIRCTDGKAILELRPAVRWHKGMAVSLLADAGPERWLPIYIGDDTTDESAFRAVKPDGIAIHVGDGDGGTDATRRIPTQSAVADCFGTLAGWLDELTERSTSNHPPDRP